MIPLSQSRMKRLTAIHGWSGGLARPVALRRHRHRRGRRLRPEIGRWSAGGAREAAIDRPVDAHVRALARQVDPAYRHDVGVWGGHGRDLHVFFHDARAQPRRPGHEDDSARCSASMRRPATCSTATTASSGSSRRPARRARCSSSSWTCTSSSTCPSPWGLILTGMLGLMMMAAVTTGLLIHRHLIRDLFLAERPGGRLASARDRHVLAASWSIPFAFLLAFTGSFFSFAGTIAFPLRRAGRLRRRRRGDVGGAVRGRRPPEDPTPTPLASLDYILANSDRARRRAGHLHRHLRLRPRRRPRLRLARPPAGRPL